IRRVSPWLRGSEALLIVDGEGGEVASRRYANGWDFGAKDGSLVAAKHGGTATTPLWPLEGDAAVEALRVIPTETGWSLVFRRAGKIVHGELRSENGKPVPEGTLVVHDSTAEKVGPPTIAKNHGHTMIAWAEKQEANWTLKVFSSTAGATKTFSTRGNPQAADQLSPSLAAVNDQAFFFTWTEGAGDKNEVWGVLLDSNVNVSGSLTRLSWEGGNAGKAQVAVGKDGRGIVGFLEGSGKQMDVIASSIVCRSDAP
ncbi:MAG: hypothetical protein KBF88_15345, partial [Polyangiaceae bacterium]|nr:hypothetical protein [Polyangiaceae bacterium]